MVCIVHAQPIPTKGNNPTLKNVQTTIITKYSLDNIPLYSKLEIGLELPLELLSEVDLFLRLGKGNGINPFNPKAIDLYAEFTYGDQKWRRNAFYYRPYQRDTSTESPNNWVWHKTATDHPFRIRFTPDQVGNWKTTIYGRLSNGAVIAITSFEFECIPSDLPGFVRVSSNKKRLTRNQTSFFPTGQNLPHPTCYLQYDTAGKITYDPYGCATVDCANINLWCDRLPTPKPYLIYLQEVEKLQQAGGNYYRMMNYPFSYELEFEQLGDYSNRLHLAWELDQLIQKNESLGLVMQWCLSWSIEYSKESFGVKHWDWYPGKTGGYCYATELGLEHPDDFLTDTIAQRHYKNKLRYIIARWGYSTSIGVLSLINEINGNFNLTPYQRYDWYQLMTGYLKDSLQTRQLLTVNYAGEPNIEQGDSSFLSSSIDLMTYNLHTVQIQRNQTHHRVKHYVNTYQKPLFFSEIGTGGTETERCDGHTEWVKDLWTTPFMGLAGTANNWNEAHNYDLWTELGSLNQFLSLSRVDTLLIPTTLSRSDELAEGHFLIHSEKKNNAASGVLINNTWNYYSNCTDTTLTCRDHRIEEKFKRIQTLTSDRRKHQLKMGGYVALQHYLITWVDVRGTNTYPTVKKRSSWLGNLKLKYPDLSKQTPVIGCIIRAVP